jgi:hypothetical protein
MCHNLMSNYNYNILYAYTKCMCTLLYDVQCAMYNTMYIVYTYIYVVYIHRCVVLCRHIQHIHVLYTGMDETTKFILHTCDVMGLDLLLCEKKSDSLVV